MTPSREQKEIKRFEADGWVYYVDVLAAEPAWLYREWVGTSTKTVKARWRD
jgi:hypothetical protein